MSTFYQIREISGLYVDGFLKSSSASDLLFMSCWGGESRILEFIARLSTNDNETSLRGNTITLFNDEGVSISATINATTKYECEQAQLPHHSQFGSRCFQVMVYAPFMRQLDRAKRQGVVLKRGGERAFLEAELWPTIKELCHLPLLDEWQSPVTKAFHNLELIEFQNAHNISAAIFNLNEDEVEGWITLSLKEGLLLPPAETATVTGAVQ